MSDSEDEQGQVIQIRGGGMEPRASVQPDLPARAGPETGLAVTVTYLQMLSKPTLGPLKHRPEQLAIMRSKPPSLDFYRYLYRVIGQQWCWWERRTWSNEQLAAVIQDRDVYVYVLYIAGTPVAYAELDNRQRGDLELAYFGLVPEFTGRGLGRYWLQWTVNKAWTLEPQRFWLHTCTLDHPAALTLYQKLGFVPYKQVFEQIEDPRPLMQRPWM